MNNKKTVTCKICGEKIENGIKICPHCGTKLPNNLFRKQWFIFIVVVIALFIFGFAFTKLNELTNSLSFADDGNCGVSAYAKVVRTFNDDLQLFIDVKNTSGKDISKIEFYAVYFDKDGNELDVYEMNNHIKTEDLKANESATYSCYSFVSSAKNMDLYIYSVKFADGSEWGKENAYESTILKKGIKVNVVSNL